MSIAQQIIQAGLGPGFGIGPLDDDCAIEAVFTIRAGKIATDGHRSGRCQTVHDFTGFTVVNLGA